MERTTWTDERLDDALARIDKRFDGVEHRLDRIEDRLTVEFGQVRADIGRTNSELAAFQRLVLRVSLGFGAAFFAQLVVIALRLS